MLFLKSVLILSLHVLPLLKNLLILSNLLNHYFRFLLMEFNIFLYLLYFLMEFSEFFNKVFLQQRIMNILFSKLNQIINFNIFWFLGLQFTLISLTIWIHIFISICLIIIWRINFGLLQITKLWRKLKFIRLAYRGVIVNIGMTISLISYLLSNFLN